MTSTKQIRRRIFGLTIAMGLWTSSTQAEGFNNPDVLEYVGLPSIQYGDPASLSLGTIVTSIDPHTPCATSWLWVGARAEGNDGLSGVNCIPVTHLAEMTSESDQRSGEGQTDTDDTRWSYPRLSFTPEFRTFQNANSLIVSRYNPPSELGKTRIIGYGYRDFKNCTENTAVRIQYTSHFSVPSELTAHSLLSRYGGMPAVRFEHALVVSPPDSLVSVLEMARSANLMGDYSEYAINTINCSDPEFK